MAAGVTVSKVWKIAGEHKQGKIINIKPHKQQLHITGTLKYSKVAKGWKSIVCNDWNLGDTDCP